MPGMVKPNRKSDTGICGVESLEQRRLMSVAFGSNLVLNPGAEMWNGLANGYNVITPTDWTATGDPTVAQYNRFFGVALDVAEPSGSGKAFFTGGPDTNATQLYQSVDLSSIATQIDAGQINFDMSAALGGYSHFNDYAQLYVIFKNAAGTEISSAVTGTVLASDRNNASKLLYRTQTGTVPAGTRSAEVLLQFNRIPTTGYNYAFADDVRFLVYTNTTSTVGITPSVARSTLPTSAVSGLKVPGDIDLNLINTSTSKNIGTVTVSLFASTDGKVDSSSILVDTVKHSFTFGANQVEQLDIPVKTLTVPSGTYTIFARTTDPYGTVDTAATGPTIAVEPQTVALALSINSISPTVVEAGKEIAITLTVENSGNVASTGLASVVIALSSNGLTATEPLTTIPKRVTVQPGDRPAVLKFLVKIPTGLTGVFDPFVTFALNGNSVTAIDTSPVTVTV
jgi:hypothetical protein